MTKSLFSSLALLACGVTSVVGQNYQTQYPYDPYNPAPVPQSYQQQPAQQYSTYNNTPSYGGSGDYSKQSSYGSSASSGLYGGSNYARLLSWGHLEGHYAYNDFRGDDRLEGDSGFGVNLRVKLMNPLFLHFGLDRITATGPQARDLEITTFSAGGGVYIPIGQRVHIYGEVGVRYDWTDGELEFINTDDVSLYVRPGIRFAATEKLELTASLLLYNTDNLNDRIVEVSAYYSLLDWLDLGGGVDFGSDINTYRLGGRWRWK